MRKRTIIAILVAFVLTIGATALWSAQGFELDGDTDTNVIAASGSEAGENTEGEPKKKGNRFGRFFKAPFKAVGRLFGAGGDDKKLSRMTEKDAEKFESVGVQRVEDANNERPAVSEGGSAREHLERGREALESGRLNEAIAELSRATSLDPRMSQAHNLLAVAFERKGLPDRASDSYKRALDADDDDPQVLNNVGYSLYVRGQYRAAIDKLKRAAKLSPNDNLILNNLALAQLRVGKYDDAYKNFARAGGAFNAHMNVASLLMRVGREERAIEHLEDARKINPDSTRVLSQLAALYDQTGRKDRADEARQALHVLDERNSHVAVAGGQ